MKFRAASILFLLFFVVKAYSSIKPRTIHWNVGVVVLEDKTVISGKICYKHDYSLVLVKNNLRIISYQASTVSSIRYYDEAVNINRLFVRLREITDKDDVINANTIYEVVVDGNIQLLRTPQKYTGVYMKNDDLLQRQRSYNYYLSAFGSLIKLSNFREDLLPQLVARDGQVVQKLIDENKLNINNPGDCILLVVLYNQANIGSGVELTSL